MIEQQLKDEREQAVKRGGEIYADHYMEGLLDGWNLALKISSNPLLADSSKTDSETEFLDAMMNNIKKYYPKKCKIQF